MNPTGYLITNLGTPASPGVADVRTYLDEFLMDPYVVTAPWLIRRLLLSLIILPSRPARSAEAYRSIWTDEGSPMGSPLLANSISVRDKLRTVLEAPVELGMRYGQPSLSAALDALREQGVEHIVVAPLYPQHADSTVTTTREQIENTLAGMPGAPVATFIDPFYADRRFIEPLAAGVAGLNPGAYDHLLLSYHGLPEQHLKLADPTGGHCLAREDCCSAPSEAHATCYRHQVFATSQALASALGLAEGAYSVSFQSRLGRLPWLRPYTDEVLAALPGRGVKRLLVACPAFVADNLETLEEIAMQGRDTFMAAGGETYDVVPCLNDDDAWVTGLAALLQSYANAPQSLPA